MRIFGTSFPRAGTHLLTAAFARLGFATVACPKLGLSVRVEALQPALRPGQVYAYGHWRAEPAAVAALREHGFQVIVLLRDPRDLCLSLADFLRAGEPASLIAREPWIQALDRRELVARLITGTDLADFNGLPIARRCEGWIEWQDHGAVLLRYEALHDSARRSASLAGLAALGLDPAAFGATLGACLGDRGGRTFNTGRADRWREEFDDGLIALWNRHARGVATRFGYEECPGAAAA
ncbi:hypothetical protein [Falsiroseomonas sp.]|uniref:hypothetical protein n=1 Tax=Falsiroseomonas sp. TaxID=2870721 RepID=UPI0035682ABB